MNRLSLWTAAIIVAMESGMTVAQQDFSKVQIKTTHVGGNVYMLAGRGGNIGVSVGPDGVLIVDDEFAPLAEKIRAAIDKIGKGKLKFVLNTHHHGDHTGGNAKFGPEAPIIAQSNVRKRLATEQKTLGRVTPASPKEALPVITFDESLTVHFNDEDIKVIHFPHSHTDGDSVIFFTKSNVVHMGDLFFMGMFPFVDLDAGGDVEGLTKSVEKVIAELKDGVKVIPGHGPLSTAADLKTYHQMLVETMAVVRKGIKAGKSLAEIQAQGVSDEWKPWGTGFIKTDRWIETIHTSLLRSRL